MGFADTCLSLDDVYILFLCIYSLFKGITKLLSDFFYVIVFIFSCSAYFCFAWFCRGEHIFRVLTMLAVFTLTAWNNRNFVLYNSIQNLFPVYTLYKAVLCLLIVYNVKEMLFSFFSTANISCNMKHLFHIIKLLTVAKSSVQITAFIQIIEIKISVYRPFVLISCYCLFLYLIFRSRHFTNIESVYIFNHWGQSIITVFKLIYRRHGINDFYVCFFIFSPYHFFVVTLIIVTSYPVNKCKHNGIYAHFLCIWRTVILI